ncbi:hypothetical protein LIER_26976 [Lithospermum erythrorhizon]|uniref:Histone acetyltransferase n=1 Tax=Lithospermum erythrorhizon TaxID=34254 RepID=A0AAV3RDK8_LITER
MMSCFLHRLCSSGYLDGLYIVRYSGVDRCISFSLLEVYQYLDERIHYWDFLRPSRPTLQLFTDDQQDFEEDMAFFMSLHTNMVGYRKDAYFLLEAYNPHGFSKQLGFSPAIPGFKSRSRDTVLAFEGLRYWRSYIATELGQSVTFPSASKPQGSCKGYSDWLDSVFSVESIISAPLGPGKANSAPRLPRSAVPSSSKPLKKRSLHEDDSADRDPKHAKWSSTRRPGPVVVSSPDVHAAVTKDFEATLLSEIVPSLGAEAQTEVVDSKEPSDCMITEVPDIEASGDEAQTEVVDIKELLDCMITEVASAEVPTGVQRTESILRDSLKVASVELCSFVEGNSHEALLVEEEGIMASFEAFTRFSIHDLSSQGKDLKVVFSKARHVRDAWCGVILPEVHDKIMAIQTASLEENVEEGQESRVE